MTQTNEMPQSEALSEADPSSLQELLSRDPEGYQGQDLPRVIEGYRAQRARWKAAGAQAGPKARKAISEKAKGLLATQAKEEDLGL